MKILSLIFFRVKRVSALYIDEAKKNLLIGTEGGNVHSADLQTFTLSENIIHQDMAMQKYDFISALYSIYPESLNL